MKRWGRNLLIALSGALAFFFLTVFIEERQVFLAPLVAAKDGPAPESDREALVEAVRAHNQRVMEAYARRDPSLVRATIAEEELAELVAADLQFLSAGGRTLRLELLGLEVGGVRRMGPARASLTVTEDWVHEYRDARSGAGLSPPQRSRERLTYHLAKTGGRWRVVGASARPGAEERRQ